MKPTTFPRIDSVPLAIGLFFIVIVPALWSMPGLGSAQELGGASRPSPTPGSPPGPDGQYKRIGQWAMTLLLDEQPQTAVDYLRDILGQREPDEELYFLLTLALAHVGEMEQAQEAWDQSLELGLSAERYLTGPRELLGPLQELEAWQELKQASASKLVHGPMLGAIQSDKANIWFRTAQPSTVRVIAGPSADAMTIESEPVQTDETTDFTGVATLTGLQPETEYHYRVIVDDQPQQQVHRLRMLTPPGEKTRFSLVFGGGAGFTPEHERMWSTIQASEPDLMLLLGDNVYSDNPERPAMQRYCYYRRQSRPEFRELVAHTPVLTIWDDHDFGTDDSWGGPDIDVPAWKRPVWNIFRQNWANPSYGGGEEQPGVWYEFQIGDVQFFMLDGRYYRTDAGRRGGDGVDNPSMLGPAQKAWLKNALAQSEATFNVLVSPVPWDFRTKPGQGGLDTWRGYADEREEIFSWIEQQQVEGVILLSADRHRSDAWRIERPEGYDLFEFNSSRLTNIHVHRTMDEALFSYNEKQSFGHVTFDTQRSDPQVTYRIVSIDGEGIYTLDVPRSRLSLP